MELQPQYEQGHMLAVCWRAGSRKRLPANKNRAETVLTNDSQTTYDGPKREELTLVHCNPCTAWMERDSTCDSHMHSALSGPKQFGKHAKTLTKKKKRTDSVFQTHDTTCRTLKNRHSAQAAMRRSVLSVLGCSHEEGMKNLH